MYSITFLEEKRFVLGGVLFAVLLNMKHLFAYLAPVYFFFLLKHYVLTDSSSSQPTWSSALQRLLLLGGAVLAVCGVSFGPFVAVGQMQQVRPSTPSKGHVYGMWAASLSQSSQHLNRQLQPLPAVKAGVSHALDGQRTRLHQQ